MTTQDFDLISKENVKQPKTTEVQEDATTNEKAVISTLFHREKSPARVTPDENTDEHARLSPLQKEIIWKRVLKSLPMTETWQTETSKSSFQENLRLS